MTSITAGVPRVNVPVLSKTTVSIPASLSMWPPLLMMMPAGQHGSWMTTPMSGRDANAGAVIDNDERKEAVEITGDRSGTGSEPKRRRNQPIGKSLGMILHPGVADRRGFHEVHDLAGGGRRADRRARTVIWPSRMTVAAKAASPIPCSPADLRR